MARVDEDSGEWRVESGAGRVAAGAWRREDGGVPPTDDGGVVTEPPPVHSCDDGETVCGDNLPECPAGSLCQFGCCVLIPSEVG